MKKRSVLRIGLSVASIGISMVTSAIWWLDGAWVNGAMPTHGVVTVLTLTGCSLLSLLAATWFDRRI